MCQILTLFVDCKCAILILEGKKYGKRIAKKLQK